jgi:hypothetical protein
MLRLNIFTLYLLFAYNIVFIITLINDKGGIVNKYLDQNSLI